jgi:hypothetical protein
MFKIILTQIAAKDIKEFPIDIQHRIIDKLKEYSSNPFFYVKKLTHSDIGD